MGEDKPTAICPLTEKDFFSPTRSGDRILWSGGFNHLFFERKRRVLSYEVRGSNPMVTWL